MTNNGTNGEKAYLRWVLGGCCGLLVTVLGAVMFFTWTKADAATVELAVTKQRVTTMEQMLVRIEEAQKRMESKQDKLMEIMRWRDP